MKRFTLLFSILLFMVGITSCNTSYTEYGFFEVKIRGDEVDIYGITEEGEQQEMLIFPSEIDGRTIINIGYSFTIKYSLNSTNLHVAVINKTNRIYDNAFVNLTRSSAPNILVMIFNSLTKIELPYNLIGGRGARIVIPFEVFDEYNNSDNGNYVQLRDYFEKSRVSFYYNYEGSPNDDLYWTSYDKEEEMITKPTDPTRDDYQFKGWYYEKEGTTEFNFEDGNTISITDVALYAKWE